LGFITAIIAVPFQFGTSAASEKKSGLYVRTESGNDGLAKMWDIREQSGDEFTEALARFRQTVGMDATRVADVRDGFVRGEQTFRQQHPGAKVEYNLDIRTPEILTPDVYEQSIRWLTSPTTANRATVLRDFIKGYNDLIGLSDTQIDALKTAANYANPDGNLSYVRLEQEINGIPVFRGEMTAGFRHNGQMIRVVNNLAPGLDYGRLSTTFGDPLDAVTTAAKHINHDLRAEDVTRNDAESTDLRVVFGSGDWATLAEKMYFPTEPGVAVPAWRVLIWQPINAYYVIVDAESGVVLWHKNLSDDQSEAATYSIYGNSNAYINAADHAAPLSPGPNDPGLGTQGTLLTRTNVTLIGNEGANSFNNNGWITDGTNITDGNANEAGIDRVAPNGVDAPLTGDSACPGAGCRTFTSTWNPPPGAPPPGDAPLDPPAQRGAVTQMFYLMNLYHDELYKRGFNEPARNFQHLNFAGAGGVAGDRVSSEGQDSSGTNNANFATPADGSRGRMQMFLWTGPTPDRDGTADAAIVIHEVTHGTSNRQHGNGSGLGNQGGMMGEGWGDFYAHTLTAEPTDPINAVYGLGGYSLLDLGGPWTANHYYGIRRFPTAVKAFTGGPNNLPHNPLTFGHINSNCDTTLGTPTTAVSSAYPRNPRIATSGSCAQVHNAGEIWKSALWEVRALMVTRLGFATGTTRVLDVVTNGMKLAPVNPTMLQERDAIVATAAAIPVGPETSADADDVREGFRIRGMGCFASVQSASSVTENFAPCAPDFSVAVTPPTQAVCVPATATYNVNITTQLGFVDPVTLSATGNPAGSTVTFTPNPVNPTPGTSTMTVTTTGVAAGSYTITVTGTSGALVHSQQVTLNVFSGTPGTPTLTGPANGSTTATLSPTFTWAAVAGAATYEIQVATDAGFSNIVASATGLTTPTFTPASPLGVTTQHFWRVRAVSPCGNGQYSAVFSFTTPCSGNYVATTQTGQTIPAGGVLVPGSQIDDGPAVPITLPAGWTSSVYGIAVTSLSASGNGNMKVNAAATTTFTNTALPASAFGATPNLFAYWDDLIMTTANVTGGGIYTNTIGAAPNREFYIEWRAQHFSETANGPITINFAIVLTEGSDVVRYIYAATGIGAQAGGASATVGIQKQGTGTDFTQFSFNTASLSPGLQITLAPPSCGGTPTPTPPPTPGVTPTPSPTPPPATPTPTPPPATPTPTPTPPPGCAGQTFPASGLPLPVPDVSSTSTNILVSGLTGTLTSAQLRNLTWSPIHTWGGDIKMTLQAPSGGPTATIFERRGNTVCPPTGVGSSNDLVGPYNFGDGFPNTFHTVAGNPVPAGDYSASQCVTTPGEAVSLNTIFGGPVRPAEDRPGLEVFDGMAPEAANGSWTLTVSDGAAGDTGTISAVNLCLVAGGGGSTPTPTPTPPPATPSPTPTPGPSPSCTPTVISEGFDTITANVPGPGWFAQNNSTTVGTTTWFQGNSAVFPSHTGAPTSYIGANFNSTTGASTISTWLLTPAVTLQNGAQMTFWTRGTGSSFPDRLQVRMSTNGASTNVGTGPTGLGDFTTLLLDINPTYQTGAGGYPSVWTQQTITVTGVPSPTLGRFAFRYFVENGGPSGANSDYIGIDTFAYNAPCGPNPTPTPTPPPATPTPTPTPPPASPTPTPSAFSITFAQNPYTEDESQTAVIGIVRSGDLSGTNAVTFTTSNGTATGGAAPGPGVDYQTVAQAVVFNPGDTFKTVNVPIFSDTLNEPTETVNLTLTGPGTFAPEVQNAVLNINDTASAFRFGGAICSNLGGAAAPYPAPITVAGGPLQIGAMRVTLYDLEHIFPDHLDVLLVGPGGQKYVLMGDAGGAIAIPSNNTVTLSFRDAGPGVLPNSGPLTTGNFEPTTWETPVTNFPAPAPAGPYNEPGSTAGGTGTQTLFGNFGLTNANGTWNLYIRDDAGVPIANPEAVTGCISDWGIEFLTLTAANASVSGRVLTAGGQGIRNAEVVISGGTLTEPMRVQTGSFGYYNFEGLQTGQTYMVIRGGISLLFRHRSCR